MKKYTTPNMNISIFSDSIEMSASGGTEPQQYVGALKDLDNKKQVNISELQDITSFVF